ncbi:Uncharacterized protein Fot_50151 [Forsythia ovata]|uniref:Uncharacterized protein n=1 Tax=Forsythia ovata TaxID=205694 RepID=A0ABD1PXB1_9LAMI
MWLWTRPSETFVATKEPVLKFTSHTFVATKKPLALLRNRERRELKIVEKCDDLGLSLRCPQNENLPPPPPPPFLLNLLQSPLALMQRQIRNLQEMIHFNYLLGRVEGVPIFESLTSTVKTTILNQLEQ